MAHRPKRTFRQRRADSSDSDDAPEPCEEAGTPGQRATPGQEEEPPSSGPRAEVTERTLKTRTRRMRGRVWASSRRAGGTAPQADVCAGAAGDSGRAGAWGGAMWAWSYSVGGAYGMGGARVVETEPWMAAGPPSKTQSLYLRLFH